MALHRVTLYVDDALYRRALAALPADLNWSEGFRGWLRDQLEALAAGALGCRPRGVPMSWQPPWE